MSHKRKGQLTTSREWVKHLRPILRRAFWKGERKAEHREIRQQEDLAYRESVDRKIDKLEDEPI